MYLFIFSSVISINFSFTYLLTDKFFFERLLLSTFNMDDVIFFRFFEGLSIE